MGGKVATLREKAQSLINYCQHHAQEKRTPTVQAWLKVLSEEDRERVMGALLLIVQDASMLSDTEVWGRGHFEDF